ncbi:uncharacterized protein C8A04DRAFT_33052 [Dichotomopilus funicola]|uniref:C3H1-type domain-containing protein n=1 Tax=Dichotomopilus funicola TaxID=1934379 RepID=A0AAN6UUR1_9PEZI|nr:hypothetical protein C8A04DRAFT_33052 [Dichotomopilus funicola]
MDNPLDNPSVSPTASTVSVGNTITGLIQRYHALSAQRDSEDNLIQDLIVFSESLDARLESVESQSSAEITELASRLRDTELELQDTHKSKEDLEQKVQQLEEVYLQNPNCPEDENSYVIVLLDANFILFKKHLVKQGVEGGEKAANDLRSAILGQCGAYSSEIRVIAKAYANFEKLSKEMCDDGSLNNEQDLGDFFVGFTQAISTFDFVNIGTAKGQVGRKIKELTTWHLRNINCKQVILGISHDTGYALFLDNLFQDSQVRFRVIVLEGITTVPEIVKTGVNILNLNDSLFRSEKSLNTTPPKGPKAPRAPRALMAPKAPSPPTAPTFMTAAKPTAPAMPTPTHPPIATYAGAVQKPTPPPSAALARPLAQQESRPTTKVSPSNPTWTPGPRGLDPPLKVAQSALGSIRIRAERRDSSGNFPKKLCNNHYLRGPSAKGNKCEFEHKYRLSSSQKAALAYLTRLTPCAQGQECDVKDCIYGHHTPKTPSSMAPATIQIFSDIHLKTHASYDFHFKQTAPNPALLGPQLLHPDEEDVLVSTELLLEEDKEIIMCCVPDVARSTIGRFVFLDQTRHDVNDTLTVLDCALFSRVTLE